MHRTPVPRVGVALMLRRRPRLRSGLVGVIALLCGLAVAATVQDAEHAREAWGSSTRVLVATEVIGAGERLAPDNTDLVAQPAPVVPDGALTNLPAGRRVATPVYAGEVIRAERLAPTGTSALAARLPDGTRGVAIPVEPGTTPTLAVGDLVEVLVALPAEVAGGGPPGFALATGVPVVEVTDAAVTIAVDRDAAPRLAAAFGEGAVTLAVVGT